MAKEDAVFYRRSTFVSKLGRKIEKDPYYGKIIVSKQKL